MNVPSNDDGTTGESHVKLQFGEVDRLIFGFEGVVRLEGGVRVETIKEKEGGILDALPEKWEAAVSCFICEPKNLVEKGPSILASLMKLSASEVRAALEAGGFDFKKFVSK